MNNEQRAAAEIVAAATANPMITACSLEEELIRGEVWVDVAARHDLTIAQWSAAMQMAIKTIQKASTKTQ